MSPPERATAPSGLSRTAGQTVVGERLPRPRVLHVIDSLAPAGAERSLLAIAPHLLEAGIDLHVTYLREREGLRDELEGAGVPVHRPAEGDRGRAHSLRRTAHLVDSLRPQVVHTTLFEADLAGRLAAARYGVPCVSSLVNVAYGAVETQGLPRARVRAAWAADAVTGVLVTRWHAVTRNVAEVMGRRLAISPHHIEVIPRGRDAADLGRRTLQRRAEVRASLGVPRDAPVVLAVGRQERQKGHDVLLRALPQVRERHPSVVVLLAGREGQATPELQSLRAELGLGEAVRFLGMRDDVPDLLAGADLLAFPSRWEGAAGTVLEAMALECPVVATALPGVREAVDEDMATLVNTEDADALAQAISSVLADRAAAARRASLARRRFERDFTIGATATRTADLYRRVASAGRRRRHLEFSAERPSHRQRRGLNGS